jgi:Tfp pilus assembly protein PilX
MARARSLQMRNPERGIALIMVILILLILTVLGMTATMLMTQEDRISSRQDMQKAALYAAEAGLRHGEEIFTNTPYTNAMLTAFVSHVASSTITMAAPDPVPIQPAPWDINHLGTYLTEFAGGSAEVVNHEINQLPDGTNRFYRIRTYFSLYVRNNPEDTDAAGLQTPLINHDARLRLVSVGFVTDPDGVDGSGNARVLAVKVLEEEFNWSGIVQGNDPQKLGDAGGTSSHIYSGGG